MCEKDPGNWFHASSSVQECLRLLDERFALEEQQQVEPVLVPVQDDIFMDSCRTHRSPHFLLYSCMMLEADEASWSFSPGAENLWSPPSFTARTLSWTSSYTGRTC